MRDGLELSVVENEYGTINEHTLLDDLKVSQAMSKKYVKVLPTLMLKEAMKLMHDNQQNCALVVDNEDFLEGILTSGDIRRRGFEKYGETPSSPKGDSTILDVNTCLVSSCFTRGFRYQGKERGLLTCFPDTDLTTAKELMEAKGIKQLPVVKRGGDIRNERKRRLVALLRYGSIGHCLRGHRPQVSTTLNPTPQSRRRLLSSSKSRVLSLDPRRERKWTAARLSTSKGKMMFWKSRPMVIELLQQSRKFVLCASMLVHVYFNIRVRLNVI